MKPIMLNPDLNDTLALKAEARRLQAARAHARTGRLFEGKSPNSELNEGRIRLFQRWDRIIAYFNARNPPSLLRYLKANYVYWDRSKDPDCEPMRFLEDLRSHNEAEVLARGNR